MSLLLYSHLHRQVGTQMKGHSLVTVRARVVSSTHTDGIPHTTTVAPSMLHCVMESETLCAALFLAPSARRVILKTSLIYEAAIRSQRNLLAAVKEGRRRRLLTRLICCSMWVGCCRFVIVRGRVVHSHFLHFFFSPIVRIQRRPHVFKKT